MKSEDYKRGVEDALRWVQEDYLVITSSDELEKKFWRDHQQLTDDDRYEAFLRGADTYISILKGDMQRREAEHPDDLHHDGPWLKAYLSYVQAKTLRGDKGKGHGL